MGECFAKKNMGFRWGGVGYLFKSGYKPARCLTFWAGAYQGE